MRWTSNPIVLNAYELHIRTGIELKKCNALIDRLELNNLCIVDRRDKIIEMFNRMEDDLK